MKSLRITKDRTGQVAGIIRALTRKMVMVGVPSTTARRDKDPDDPTPLNNAELAYIHSNGSPAANIPARPFLEPGIKTKQKEITATLKAGAAAALDGRPEVVDKTLHTVGLMAQAAVRAKITDGPFEPLKPRTLAARRRRGRTGTKPLIDTTQLRTSINYVIRDRGAK